MTSVNNLTKKQRNLFTAIRDMSFSGTEHNMRQHGNRGCWLRYSSYCVDGFHFPAVYAFYDKYDNIVYIGKATDLSERMASHYADGHLKAAQYDKVVKVMYSRCETTADATILETILIPYYRPVFNRRDKGVLPTIVDVEEIVHSLKWECFFDNQIEYNEEKKQLKDELSDFDDWTLTQQIDFISKCYEKYVLSGRNDGNDLFEMVLYKAIGNYMDLMDRERVCTIITKAYLPGISPKWFYFCYKNMNQGSFYKHGDIYRAFAHNYYASFELIGFLCGYRWVTPLFLYAFDESNYNNKDISKFKLMNKDVCNDSIPWKEFTDNPNYENMRDNYHDRFLEQLESDWLEYNRKSEKPSKSGFSKTKEFPSHVVSKLLTKIEESKKL